MYTCICASIWRNVSGKFTLKQNGARDYRRFCLIENCKLIFALPVNVVSTELEWIEKVCKVVKGFARACLRMELRSAFFFLEHPSRQPLYKVTRSRCDLWVGE